MRFKTETPLDQQMAKQGYEMIRYADDFVMLCRSEAEAGAAPAEVQAWTASAGLTLHPTKTRIVDARIDELRLEPMSHASSP